MFGLPNGRFCNYSLIALSIAYTLTTCRNNPLRSPNLASIVSYFLERFAFAELKNTKSAILSPLPTDTS